VREASHPVLTWLNLGMPKDAYGSRRLLAAVFKPDAIRRILKSLKLPTEPLPIAPARPPPGNEWLGFESA